MKRALSISGGGIRGIIPIQALIALEDQLGGLVRDHFDYVAGCSTGSALTALIMAGVPMRTALTFYTGEDAKRVFSPQLSIEQDALRLSRGYIFNPVHLADALDAALGPANKWTLNDCPKGVLIIAMDASGKPWFFCKDNVLNGSLTGNCSLVDATVASCCAPTYFDFWPVKVGNTVYQMADGGTGDFADPVHRMAVELFEFDKFRPDQTNIVSLGTGFYVAPDPSPKPVGLLATISWATSTLVNMSENLAQQDVRREYRTCEVETLNPPLADVDEAALSAVPLLVQVGADAAAKINWKEIMK